MASTVLSDPQTAFEEIDRVLHAVQRYKRPAYIELPRDMAGRPGIRHHSPSQIHEASDPAALAEAIEEAVAMINHSLSASAHHVDVSTEMADTPAMSGARKA